MEDNHNEFTEAENLGRNSSAKEGKIDSLELAMEIYPLLEDYFCGTFAKNSKGVLMKMDNGQVFQLTVEEVA